MIIRKIAFFRKTIFAISALFIVLLFSCGKSEVIEESDLNYGMTYHGIQIGSLRLGYQPLNQLINIVPDSRIFVCSDRAKLGTIADPLRRKLFAQKLLSIKFYTVEAVKHWLQILGRDTAIQVLPAECDDPDRDSKRDGQVRVRLVDCRHLDYSAIVLPSLPQFLRKNRLQVEAVFCMRERLLESDDTIIRFLATHEAGHGFGLCDQYYKEHGKTKLGFSNICDKLYRSEEPAISIMNWGRTQDNKDGTFSAMEGYSETTDDDKLGIRLLTCSADFEKSTLAWLEYDANLLKKYKADSYNIMYENDRKYSRPFMTEVSKLRSKGANLSSVCI
ncbi:MAG: hypothetical protein KBD78_07045 [Oligoflexales bacterium]|nr:hypothetical protein [Oligoflexales bacterium]